MRKSIIRLSVIFETIFRRFFFLENSAMGVANEQRGMAAVNNETINL